MIAALGAIGAIGYGVESGPNAQVPEDEQVVSVQPEHQPTDTK
jgi:hypothetical protein